MDSGVGFAAGVFVWERLIGSHVLLSGYFFRLWISLSGHLFTRKYYGREQYGNAGELNRIVCFQNLKFKNSKFS